MQGFFRYGLVIVFTVVIMATAAVSFAADKKTQKKQSETTVRIDKCALDATPKIRFTALKHPTTFYRAPDDTDVSNANRLAHLKQQSVVIVSPEAQASDVSPECNVLKAVTIFVEVKSSVSVPANYHDSSCQARVSREHEEEHLKAMDAYLASLEQRYKPLVLAHVLQFAGFNMARLDQLNSTMEKLGEKLIVEVNRDHNAIHRQLDAPQAQSKHYVKCLTW